MQTEYHHSKLFFSSKNSSCQEALEKLLETPDLENQTFQVYKNMNFELKKCHNGQQLTQFLEKIQQNKLFPNIFILNQLMQKFFQFNEFHLALHVFRFIKQHQLENTITYNTLLSKLSLMSISKEKMIELFLEAKEKKLIDTVSYNTLLHFFAKNCPENFVEAFAFFQEAKQLQQINLVTVASILYVISKQRPSNSDLALTILQDAKSSLGKPDAVIYANCLLCIANSATPKIADIMNLFEEAIKDQQLNAYIVSNALHAISKTTQPDIEKALEILNTAKSHHITDARSYGNTLNILAKSRKPNPKLAYQLLQEAIQHQQIDNYIFSQALDVFANTKNAPLKQAVSIYEAAKHLNFANHFTSTLLLQVIAKQPSPDLLLAKNIFNEAQNLSKTDAHLYSSYIQVLANALKQTPYQSEILKTIQKTLQLARTNQMIDSNCYANALQGIGYTKPSNLQLAINTWKASIEDHAINIVVATQMLYVFEQNPCKTTLELQYIYQDCKRLNFIDKPLILQLLKVISVQNDFDLKFLAELMGDLESDPHYQNEYYPIISMLIFKKLEPLQTVLKHSLNVLGFNILKGLERLLQIPSGTSEHIQKHHLD